MTVEYVKMSQELLTEFSEHIDERQPLSAPKEAVTWARLAKVSEQAGEALGDHIRAKGQNVLKEDLEVTHEKVADRVLSVAFSALATYEHLTGNDGKALTALLANIEYMHDKIQEEA